MERGQGQELGDDLAQVGLEDLDPSFDEVLVEADFLGDQGLALGDVPDAAALCDVQDGRVRLGRISCPDHLNAPGNGVLLELLEELGQAVHRLGPDGPGVGLCRRRVGEG